MRAGIVIFARKVDERGRVKSVFGVSESRSVKG